jgi:hypothetical protein
LGIEIQGSFTNGPAAKAGVFEDVTFAQNESLSWLIFMLQANIGIPDSEIFRHPEVSYKMGSEAQTANWKWPQR